MPFSFAEVLTGGITPVTDPFAIQPLALDLVLRGRGVVEALLGAPLDVTGAYRADDAPVAGPLPRHGVVWGTLRFLVSEGLFYDLRLAEQEGIDPRDVAALRGARCFRRGDLWASATTFDGELQHRGERIASVRLRFDARDDVPSLARSFRRAG